MKRIVILNGPNLNLVGIREPEVYGNVSMKQYLDQLTKSVASSCELIQRQSNIEGELIDWLHEFGFSVHAIVINPGGYAHTSVAIADAIRAIECPVVEVHISNVNSREAYRHDLLTGAACVAVLSGFGLVGYEMAVNYLINNK